MSVMKGYIQSVVSVFLSFLNLLYSSKTDPSTVCAPQVCVGSIKLYSKLGQAK